jgi:phenylpropionate dioxygenase-like ring-hydroxylating dioxygenase large terminal subunit
MEMPNMSTHPDSSVTQADPDLVPYDVEMTPAEKQYPLAPHVLDADHYRDPAQYERELELVFTRAWFPVCPSGDLAEPRDFVVWDRLQQSIVIVRRDDGEIAAWHNVCQHRGARLVAQSGSCPVGTFKCPWHGFAYDLDGVVKSVPLRDSFDADLLEGLRTPQVRAEEWGGLVWITLSDDTPRLREYLGVIGDELEGFGLERFETNYRTTLELNANWKLVVDAFNETWHVPFTHKDTLTGIVMWRDAVLHIERPHSWMTIPVRGLTDRVDSPDHRKTHICHYLAFPNTIFSCFPTHLQMWTAWPVSQHQTILDAWGIVGPAPDGVTEEKWKRQNDRDWDNFVNVVCEDAEVINSFGTVVESKGFRRNMFNTAESRLTAFHAEVNALCGELGPTERER